MILGSTGAETPYATKLYNTVLVNFSAIAETLLAWFYTELSKVLTLQSAFLMYSPTINPLKSRLSGVCSKQGPHCDRHTHGQV